MKKKNNQQGFTLIELMIAITISATLISTILMSLSNLYNSFVYNTKFLELNSELQSSMQIIKYDLANAGVFGSFSFHNSTNKLFEKSGATCNNPSCNLDSNTVGVKSYGIDSLNIISNGVLSQNSDILQVQSGGYKSAYLMASDSRKNCQNSDCLINYCNSGVFAGSYYLGVLNFVDGGIDRDANTFILSSTNHIYQLNYDKPIGFGSDTSQFKIELSNSANGCPIFSEPFVKIESVVSGSKYLKYDAYDPDIQTITLNNLITNFYYISKDSKGVDGLYISKSKNGKILDKVLIAKNINYLRVEYIIDENNSLNNIENNQKDRYFICSTDRMNNSSDKDCGNKWNKVVSVSVTLKSLDDDLKSSDDQIEQELTDTVSWNL